MTNGQIQQLQDLSKCYSLPRYWDAWVCAWLEVGARNEYVMGKTEKANLRHLVHRYRNQIRAMERNR